MDNSSIMYFRCEIFNCPDYAHDRKYIVVRYVNHQLWFYGAWNNEKEAKEACNEIYNGVILTNN